MKMHHRLLIVFSTAILIALGSYACKQQESSATDEGVNLTARSIMSDAHDKAGGESWVKPQSLYLDGYGLFYSNGDTAYHEKHMMWRVYASSKDKAHVANGKVRIESIKNGTPVFMVSFDGANTYDLSGKQEQSEADKRWASNFGYGVIRHAFDDGYKLEKLEDGSVDAHKTYRIKVIDTQGGETIFDIRQHDYAIVQVGFDTPRGWHERIYSDFFKKKEYTWNQPGRVQLFYNDIKVNEIIWTDFDVDKSYDPELFIIDPDKVEI